MHASFAYSLKRTDGSLHCEDQAQPILPCRPTVDRHCG
jgi:hypothetical protein